MARGPDPTPPWRPAPASPPALLPGPSARQLGLRCATQFAAATLAWIAALALVDSTPVVLAIGVAWFLFGWACMSRFGDRVLQEVDRGYTTVVFDTGMFWFRPSGWTTWSFDGVWKFVRGEVIPPTPGINDPPGLYPSPTQPGKWRVWTGTMWADVHRPVPDGR